MIVMNHVVSEVSTKARHPINLRFETEVLRDKTIVKRVHPPALNANPSSACFTKSRCALVGFFKAVYTRLDVSQSVSDGPHVQGFGDKDGL